MSARSFSSLAAFGVGVALVASTTALALAGCSSTNNAPPPTTSSGDSGVGETGGPEADAAAGDAQTDGAIDRGVCASTFGGALTAGFGRIDGTVAAVQIPADKACTMPNGDHVIVQVKMAGAIYRLVVNVQSDRGGPDARIRYAEKTAALGAPAFAEGWHKGVTLDYVTNLGLHATAFTPLTLDEAVAKIANAVRVGAPISIYGTSGQGRPESAHLIHRQGHGDDGALVIAPESPDATWMTFSFVSDAF